jgi:ubiquinone/menaquinone biosynthesis C-methylase UbiE
MSRVRTHEGLGARCFAWWWPHCDKQLESRYRAFKEPLFEGLHGRVLEIGPGTGINCHYYAPDVQLVGVEPNPHMHKHLRRTAKEAGVALRVVKGQAESLKVEDASMDAVVSTLVLCSVQDVERSLAEVLRVLKPGGRFLFIEHVAAPRGTLQRKAQEGFAPVWRCLGDGCHPNRETDKSIDGAGFRKVSLHRERVGLIPFVTPHIVGVAVK